MTTSAALNGTLSPERASVAWTGPTRGSPRTRGAPIPQEPPSPDEVVAALLLADDEPDGPVGLPLGIKVEHLELFADIDPAEFRTELERFTAARPFVTTEDALRAVLRDFGVRAKLIADHLDLVQWDEDGWQLMEIHPNDLSRSRRI